ncbi:5-(carboxyamino)imidazole ribonucleotide synthase [Halioxenophilus sp. WMMB6]|uniref:5-(carboxyamino)imidazole ribonucleotide synthase n=1 Tax=Halioxenophilus sp. WMMB6 TaxID=3073815 RepID=UPI00295E4222|nr:5-(carboxyamino)imidazole ribonucleotide synthase [Halioxenophilus sp. WMMB6]
MAKIWVLGNGQLGAMLKHAAAPLGLDVEPVDIDSTTPITLAADDLVTAEREQWPTTDITTQLANHPNFVNLPVFPTLADRKTQKELLDSLAIATAPWRPVEASSSADELHAQLGEKVLLKRRSGGYDGRGQHWLHQPLGTVIPDQWHDHAIAEQAINFDEELSLVGVRDAGGQMFFYPLTLNLNTNGILRATVSPVARLQGLQAEAEAMLGSLLSELNYVGVMGMELFRQGGQLMVNELAPRVHNTGHWTQAGASISQFEYHMRAVAGLPLAAPWIKATSVMINLIGSEFNEQWLSVAGAEVYWYQKAVRPGRKVGHINLSHTEPAKLTASLQALAGLLEDDYQEPIAWSLRELNSAAGN